MKNGCSDRLSRAERGSLTPEEVFDMYEGQIDEELAPCGDPEIDLHNEQSTQEMRKAVALARELWAMYVSDEQYVYEEDAIKALQASDNELVRNIGSALEDGCYGHLGI